MAQGAGAMVGVAEPTWWRWVAAERTPAPIRLSPRRTVWRIAELRAWIAAGCPDRATWERMRAAAGA